LGTLIWLELFNQFLIFCGVVRIVDLMVRCLYFFWVAYLSLIVSDLLEVYSFLHNEITQ